MMKHIWSGFAGDGEHSFEVYDGVYTLFTRLRGKQGVGTADASAARLDMLVAMEVPVHGDTEVTLDAREGVLATQPEVGQEVQVRSQTTAWCHNRANDSVDCYNWHDASGNEQVDGAAYEVHVTPFPDWQLQPTWLWEQWHMGEPQPLSPVPNLDPPRNYSPTPAYLYRTALLYEHGASAQDLTNRSFSAADFVEVPTSYHADKPETIIGTTQVARVVYPWEPKPHLYGTYPGNKVYFEPGEVTEYYLADDRLTWTRTDWPHYGPEPGPNLFGLSIVGQDVFLESEAGTRREVEQHFQAPHQQGPSETNHRFWEHTRTNNFPINSLAQIPPGMVRIGDQFSPSYSHNWGSIPGRWGYSLTQGFETSWRMWNADTGEELSHPQECESTLLPLEEEECREQFWLFSMAAGPATYRLEQTDVYPGWMEPYFRTKPSGTSTTAWTFSSARSDAQLPPEYRCLLNPNDSGNDCQMQPLILLHYDLGLDTYNRALAGRRHTFTIEAGPHSEAIGAAPVTEISVQASFDDGESWEEVRAVDQGWNWKGKFRFEVEHPPLAETSGFVSLRVKAKDANGGTVDQTTYCAYVLEGVDSEKVCDPEMHADPAQAPVEGSVTTAAAGVGARVDGVTSQFVEFEVPEGVDNATAEVVAEYPQPANIDLYLQRQGADGTWGDDLASGASGELDGERMTTGRLIPGTYRIEVHNRVGPPLNEVAVTATFFNSEGKPGSD